MHQVTAVSDHPIRVTMVHPSLAKYRVPVFRELATRPGLDLRVVYGTSENVPNASPEGFQGIPVPRWEGKVASQLLMVQGSEWTYCSPQHSDVVVLRWTPRSLSLLPALLRARLNGVATILWGHGYSKSERSWWRAARNLLAKQCSALLFYDQQTRVEFIREGWDAERLYVALNCIDPTEINQARQWWQEAGRLSEFRREQGIDGNPVILFVSRLQPANRVDLLIRATAELSKVIPGLKTVIVGNGDAEKERLQVLAHTLAAENNVIFVDGTYDESKLAPWFLSASVFCYPVNIGLSLIHAFWYGLPVVTTDNTSAQNPEIAAFKNNINGLTYKHDNVSSLVDALSRIVQDKELQQSMSTAARRTVEEEYTIPRMVDGLEAAIRYAAEKRSANAKH